MNITETIRSRHQQLSQMCDETINDIVKVMQKHNVTSVDISESDDPVDVCWWHESSCFSRVVYDLRVQSVNLDKGKYLVLSTTWEDQDVQIDANDYALQNPYWLNQAYEAVCQALNEI